MSRFGDNDFHILGDVQHGKIRWIILNILQHLIGFNILILSRCCSQVIFKHEQVSKSPVLLVILFEWHIQYTLLCQPFSESCYLWSDVTICISKFLDDAMLLDKRQNLRSSALSCNSQFGRVNSNETWTLSLKS